MSETIAVDKVDYPKLNKVFVAGLYIYALGSHQGRSLISLGVGLVLLTWLIKVIGYRDTSLNKSVKHWPIFALALIMIFSRNDFWNVLTSGHVYSVIFPLAILNQLKDKKLIYKILGISLGVLFISGIVANYQYFIEGMRRAEGLARFSITSANVSVMGIGILLPFLFRKENKPWHYIIAGLGIFVYTTAIIFSMTRAAYFGLVVVLFLFTLIKKPKLIPVIILLVVLVFNFLPGNVQDRFYTSFDLEGNWIQNRLIMWRVSIDAVKENPIRGIGYDNYGDYFLEKDYTDGLRDYTSPHNNYFLFLSETGFTGFFIFLYLSYYLIKLFFLSYIKIPEENNIDRALFLGILLAVIGFLVTGLTETNIGESQTRNFFWLLVGFGFSLNYFTFYKNNDLSINDEKQKAEMLGIKQGD